MKKPYLIIGFVFYISAVYGLTGIPEFEALGPEEKVDTLLREYYGDVWFSRQLDFARKSERIANEKDQTLPYIFSLLRKYDAHPCSSGKNEVEILDNIIQYELFQVRKLNKDELTELGVIYTELLDTYLETYKKVDAMAMVLQVDLIKFTKGIYPSVNLAWVEQRYEEYTALGYEDLTIDYEELRTLIGLR